MILRVSAFHLGPMTRAGRIGRIRMDYVNGPRSVCVGVWEARWGWHRPGRENR